MRAVTDGKELEMTATRVLRTFLVVFIFTSMGCLSLRCSAAIIYNQTTPVEPGAAFSSLDLTDLQKVADNFQVASDEAVTIRSLRFIGATSNLVGTPADNFRVVFLHDNGGAPGSITIGGDFTAGTAARKFFTGGLLLSGRYEPIEYSLDLGEGVTLAPKEEYWISITNNLGQSYGWLWARANGVVDQKTSGTRGEIAGGPWEIFENGGMWFELNTHNVPEPTSILLTCSGIALLFVLRYRK